MHILPPPREFPVNFDAYFPFGGEVCGEKLSFPPELAIGLLRFEIHRANYRAAKRPANLLPRSITIQPFTCQINK
jgi:hypothetical protein